MRSPERPTVRLIGLGNIGFRHLQGLASMARDIRLEGEDIDGDARQRAGREWSGYSGADGLFVGAERGAASLAVLATSAAGREALIRRELDRGVRSLVVEKVVFTSSAPFMRTLEALAETGAVAYVNTARRLWPLYKTLVEEARASGAPVNLEVSGRSLGLACNGVHFIDLLQMLSGERSVVADDADISAPWESKRPGYYEVWGTARFRTPQGSTLSLSVAEDGPATPVVTLSLGGRRMILEEAAGRVLDDRGTVLQDLGRSPYQSELSATYARPMLAGLAPGLPDLEESSRAHEALLSVLLPAFQRAGVSGREGLPIT